MMTTDERFGIASQLHQSGRLKPARAAYEALLRDVPNHDPSLHYLGMLMCQMGRVDLGAELMNRAIECNPNIALYHNNLGTALVHLHRREQAEAAYRRAMEINPFDPLPRSNLGNVLRQMGQPRQAIEACRKALELNPDYAEAYTNLGNALADVGRNDEAIVAYHRSVTINPHIPESHNNLGNALCEAGLLDEAADAFKKAILLSPRLASPHEGLANVLSRQGCVEDCFNEYSLAAELDGSSEKYSYLAFIGYFHPGIGPEGLLGLARDWARRFAAPLASQMRPLSNDPSPSRKLRIGYVSPDFRNNVMGWLIAPILNNHDRNSFEIHCFSNVSKPDSRTDQFRHEAEKWHEVTNLSNSDLVDLIRREQIDILVDLAVHTPCNRLLAFACKPAPVQVTYLAYCGITGLETMDYVLCDKHFAPESSSVMPDSEQRFRLSTSYWCYRPNELAPEVGPLPAVTNLYITFGCLNQVIKVNAGVLDLWSRILGALPTSRLVLLVPEGNARRRIIDHFEKNGIDSTRVRFLRRQQSAGYLGYYQQLDIALDPFPYAGGNTTADALWMGVPTITLVGQTTVSRAGLSILSNVGLTEFVAETPDQYVQLAIDLAVEIDRLKELRSTLRQKMKDSPMMDERGYIAGLESAYRSMWRTWCEARS